MRVCGTGTAWVLTVVLAWLVISAPGPALAAAGAIAGVGLVWVTVLHRCWASQRRRPVAPWEMFCYHLTADERAVIRRRQSRGAW